MPFGDVWMSTEVDEQGVCRCHGRWSPRRTANGDIARVTDPRKCIEQRIAVWLACKKGERPLHPYFGCCIRSYINKPLTMAILKELKGQIQADLESLFPEYVVSNLRVIPIARNEISVEVYIGSYHIEFLGTEASLNELRTRLNAAIGDLGMSRS